MTGRTSITELTAALFELPSTADRNEAAELLAALRQALTRGLDEVATSDLRAFATLADRFGFHADAWNATSLLRRRGPLDAHARLIASRAFLELFAAAARNRPQTLMHLLGDDQGAPSDVARANLLVRWLHHVDSLLEKGHHTEAVSTLAAILEVSCTWWPALAPEDRPAAFTAAFVQRARALAEAERDLRDRDHAIAARPWATALRWSTPNMERDDPQSVVDVTGDDDAIDIATGPKTASAAQIEWTARSITDQGKRIWVIGALASKWTHIVGVAKTLGIGAKVLQRIDYGELKQRSVMDSLNVASDVGVLIGPVPHKVSDVGCHSSLVVQLQREAGIPVVDLRANDGSGTLKITKASFRTGLLDLLTEIAASRHVPIAMDAGANYASS